MNVSLYIWRMKNPKNCLFEQFNHTTKITILPTKTAQPPTHGKNLEKLLTIYVSIYQYDMRETPLIP